MRNILIAGLIFTGLLMGQDYYCKSYNMVENGVVTMASDNGANFYRHFQKKTGDKPLKVYFKNKNGIISYVNFEILVSGNINIKNKTQHIQEYESASSTAIIHIGDEFKTGVRIFYKNGYHDYVNCTTKKPHNTRIL